MSNDNSLGPSQSFVESQPSLTCTPFYSVDYVNYNKFLRDTSISEYEQLKELYDGGFLKVISFTIYTDGSQYNETTIGTMSDSFDSKYIPYLITGSTGASAPITSQLKYQLFKDKLLKIVSDSSTPGEKKLQFTIDAKKKINKISKTGQYGGAVELFSGIPVQDPFVDVGDTPDEGNMLFFTDTGKAKVNQKAVDQGIPMPYAGVIASEALTKEVVKQVNGPRGNDISITETQYASEDAKQKGEVVKKYYEDLDIYESEQIDKFLKNPIGYIPDNPPKKPDDRLVSSYDSVNNVARDDIIEKLFKKLGNGNVSINHHDMLLAIIEVQNGSCILKMYYYNGNGQFYSIERTGSTGSVITISNLDRLISNLDGLAQYIKKNNNNLTFLFIKKSQIDYTGCEIGRCFHLSQQVKDFHAVLTTQKQQLKADIVKLQNEIKELTSQLNDLKNEFENRRKTDAYKKTPYWGRLESSSNSEYNQLKIRLKTQMSEKEQNIDKKKKELAAEEEKLKKLSIHFRNMQISNKGQYVNEQFESMSLNFTLDDVVRACEGSSNPQGVGAGGNRNKRPAKKSRKRNAKKSHKRPAKKSRKRNAKKSHKRHAKKSRKY